MNVKKRKILIVYILTLSALIVLFEAFAQRYKLGYNPQEYGCIPGRWFLVDYDDVEFKRGDLAAFSSDYYAHIVKRDGDAIKIVAGMPGDSVKVSANEVVVAGRHFYGGLYLKDKIEELAGHAGQYERYEKVPAGHVMMMGSLPTSLDGRYWGYVKIADLKGKAYEIF